MTEADKDAEAFIRAELAAAHPDDAILGEEEGASTGTSGRRWIIDPIDGTKAFIRGVPLYTNLLALEDEHGWAVGVINLPALDECVYAGRGLGCFQDDRSGVAPAGPGRARGPATPFLMASGYTHWDEAALLGVKRAGWALRTWGDGYGYALVATGRVDAMVDPAGQPVGRGADAGDPGRGRRPLHHHRRWRRVDRRPGGVQRRRHQRRRPRRPAGAAPALRPQPARGRPCRPVRELAGAARAPVRHER